MSSLREKTPGFSTAGALLTLLVLLCPALATQAGCLHPALRIDTEPAGAAHFQKLIASGAMIASAEQASAAEPLAEPAHPNRRPCQGPSCSNQDDLPTPAPAPVSTLVDSWAWFRLTLVDPHPRSRLRRSLPSTPSTRRFAPAIFHPPCPETA